MKKCPCRETQTLRAGYSKTEPKIFAPPQTPFPGAHAGRPKLNQLEMVATVIVVTEPTHRRNLLQYTTAAKLSAQCNDIQISNELQFVAFTWPNLCLWVVILCPAFELKPIIILKTYFL